MFVCSVCVCVFVCVCVSLNMSRPSGTSWRVFVCVSRHVQGKWDLLAAKTKLSKKKAEAFEVFKGSCVLPSCVLRRMHVHTCTHACLMASAPLCTSDSFREGVHTYIHIYVCGCSRNTAGRAIVAVHESDEVFQHECAQAFNRTRRTYFHIHTSQICIPCIWQARLACLVPARLAAR